MAFWGLHQYHMAGEPSQGTPQRKLRKAGRGLQANPRTGQHMHQHSSTGQDTGVPWAMFGAAVVLIAVDPVQNRVPGASEIRELSRESRWPVAFASTETTSPGLGAADRDEPRPFCGDRSRDERRPPALLPQDVLHPSETHTTGPAKATAAVI
eukprot:CAMPEP_0174381580 /NCGR_PEP_ID=MMETSP0811_2-20130205/124105_1 /TAXON_ID=73025 ORGANISM="Eutreptiella gymnastica-like, Strain CCMP1594" /NCGR_SAMPLE_ID=MMETSP0811_2 /ASSEMBLY_ACC=CAM_ASM_000667 /LENGTH=152 /DNA_ID=CAMNT_0015534767 /DNA_START=1039 /DNA_END=1494 /DNA_ORIENTATION=+